MKTPINISKESTTQSEVDKTLQLNQPDMYELNVNTIKTFEDVANVLKVLNITILITSDNADIVTESFLKHFKKI